MDWNCDGKHDHQDHAFYNNVIELNEKKDSKRSNTYFKMNSNNSFQSNKNSKGTGWLVLVVVVSLYLIIKAVVRW